MKNSREDIAHSLFEPLEPRRMMTMVLQDSEYAGLANGSQFSAQGAVLLAANNPVRIEGVAESFGEDWYALRAGVAGTLTIKPSSYPGSYKSGWQLRTSTGTVLASAPAGTSQAVSVSNISNSATYFYKVDASAANAFYSVDLSFSAGGSGARFQDGDFAAVPNNTKAQAKGLVNLQAGAAGSFIIDGVAEANNFDWYAVRAVAGVVTLAPGSGYIHYSAPIQIERANGTVIATRLATDTSPISFSTTANETFYIKYTGASTSPAYSLSVSLALPTVSGDLNYLKKVTSLQYWFWRAKGTTTAAGTGTSSYLSTDELSAIKNLGVTSLRIFLGPELILKSSAAPTTPTARNARFKVISETDSEQWFEYGPSVGGVSKIDTNKYTAVRGALQNILNAGLGVVLCLYDQDIAGTLEFGPDYPYNKTNKNTNVTDRVSRINLFGGFWHDLAGRLTADFGASTNRMFLEPVNEPEFNVRGPNGDPNNAVNWRNYQRSIINNIRSAGGAPNFTIIASPNSTTSATSSYFSDIDALTNFPLEAQDKQNIVWNFHMYEPGSITSQGTKFSRFVDSREGYLHDLPYPATQADTNAITGRLTGQPFEAFTNTFNSTFEAFTDTTSNQFAHAFREQLRLEQNNPAATLRYGQWEMAGAYNSYGYGYGDDIVVNGVKYYTAGSGWNASYFKARMMQVNAWASRNGVRAFCGEFGASAAHAKYSGLTATSDGTYSDGLTDASGTPNDSRARYLRDVARFMNDPLENGTTGANDSDRIFWGIWGLDDPLAMGLPRARRVVMGGYDSTGQPRKFNGKSYIELQGPGKAVNGRILTTSGNIIDRNKIDLDVVEALGFNSYAVTSAPPPAIATNLHLAAPAVARNVKLSFTNNTAGFVSYQIRRRYVGDSVWTVLSTLSSTYTTGQAITFTDTTVPGGGVKVEYNVVALVGNNSAESQLIQVVVP